MYDFFLTLTDVIVFLAALFVILIILMPMKALGGFLGAMWAEAEHSFWKSYHDQRRKRNTRHWEDRDD